MRIPEMVEGNDLEPRTWPQIWLQKDFWMPSKDKVPVNPTKPAKTRFKWGLSENWMGFEEASKWLIDPQMKCLTMEVREEDELVFFDGDDVRDPETGKIHPGFIEIYDLVFPNGS